VVAPAAAGSVHELAPRVPSRLRADGLPGVRMEGRVTVCNAKGLEAKIQDQS
jgi:hypothetical protein